MNDDTNIETKEETKEEAKFDDDQTAALAATSAILIFMVIYWSLQIQSVRELLELAYG